jgi:hypothetical protein
MERQDDIGRSAWVILGRSHDSLTVEAYCAKNGITPCRAELEPAVESDLAGAGAL